MFAASSRRVTNPRRHVRHATVQDFQVCTICLMYKSCIWCTGNSTCHTRNTTTNLPLDVDIVVYAKPDLTGKRAYELIKFYNPFYLSPGGRYGLDWCDTCRTLYPHSHLLIIGCSP